jgi:hypothetical protein
MSCHSEQGTDHEYRELLVDDNDYRFARPVASMPVLHLKALFEHVSSKAIHSLPIYVPLGDESTHNADGSQDHCGLLKQRQLTVSESVEAGEGCMRWHSRLW